MKTFTFNCEGCDSCGNYATSTQIFTHDTEEEARRELISLLNSAFDFRPRRLTLVESTEWESSPFDFS